MSRRDEVDKLLLEKGLGRKCRAHKRLVKLGVLWAGGRAIAFFCNRDCFQDWEDARGKWGEVVRVIPVNRYPGDR